MGRVQEGRSPGDLQDLREHHLSMARSFVCGGLTPRQLARAFHFTDGQISRIIQTPIFKAECKRLREKMEADAIDFGKRLRGMVPRALEVLEDDLNAEVEGSPATRALRQKAGFAVLNRTGFHEKTEEVGRPQGDTYNIVQINQMSDDELREKVMSPEVLDIGMED